MGDTSMNKMEMVSGRILAIRRKKEDHNELFIGSRKFGTMIVKAVLSDKDVENLKMNDGIQLLGLLRLRKRLTADGTIARDVLVMKPEVKRILRTYSAIEGYDPSKN